LKAVQDSISYPVEAKKERIEGTVVVNFVVDEKGTVQNLEVMRGVHPLLDREALHVIRSLEFEPKTKNGEPVSAHMGLPVKFSLDSLKSQ